MIARGKSGVCIFKVVKTVITCPECKRENKEDTKICVYCGAPLIDITQATATRSLNDTDFEEGTPRWGSARFNARSNLVIGVDGEVRTFIYDADQISELIIGRQDPKSGDAPEIDLSRFAALEKGVSRRHASIIRKDGSLYLVDNASANGTFLNGQRVVANQPRVLRDGDDIRLGHLVIRITFERA
jgi:hypothetical protein